MYYLAKLAQAAGLGVIGIGFIADFPHMINMKVFTIGVFLFLFGWLIECYMLKR